MERKASGTPIAAPAAAPAAPTGPIDRKYANILRAMGMDASGMLEVSYRANAIEAVVDLGCSSLALRLTQKTRGA